MTLLGGAIAACALLAGFAAPGPAPLARVSPPARGALQDPADHPEWKQFLVQAAYRRADELARLRELPQATLASLPEPAGDADGDPTASISETPSGVMPVEIGETSSTELPVATPDAVPPVSQPDSLKGAQQSVPAAAPQSLPESAPAKPRKVRRAALHPARARLAPTRPATSRFAARPATRPAPVAQTGLLPELNRALAPARTRQAVRPARTATRTQPAENTSGATKSVAPQF